MYVKINRNVCPAHLAFCERCLGQFLKYPMGYERRRFEELRDDEQEALTIDLHTGHRDIRLVLSKEERLMMAGEGWATMVDFAVPMYHDYHLETPKAS